ncbi:hypothetical protein C7U60_18450 [Mesorhizobium plurifarium]|uniref:hypothetical protein n=1 Tax=Sinorhizobium arboris TaxID=76745 RepID=UPI00040B0428|nr:hypothetical protein [Sinorhizobium arboris]PST18805.1 hypothetical protein C7U60_18450 [Mesorhizobium plurifarium]
MPDSSQKNLGLHDNFSADDELKTSALADGVAANASSRSVAGGSTSPTESTGGDFTFSLGDGFSFSLNFDHVLGNGASFYEAGFSLAQANSLADQDRAYDISKNGNADFGAAGEQPSEADGLTSDGWDLKGGDGASHPSTETSPNPAGPDFHHEIVHGANLLSNVDVWTAGGDPRMSPAAPDDDAD